MLDIRFVSPYRFLNFFIFLYYYFEKERKSKFIHRILFRTQGIVLAFNTTGVMVHPPFCRPILMITVWAMFVMGALHHEDSSLRGDEFQKQERIPWRNVDYSGRKSHYDGTELAKRPSALNLTISVKMNYSCSEPREINKSIAMSKVEMMAGIKWCRLKCS